MSEATEGRRRARRRPSLGMALVYLFTALGAVPTMRNTMRKKEFSSQIYTMN